MNVNIEIDATGECGLVLQQAGRPAVNGLRIHNGGDDTLTGMSLTVTSDIGHFHPWVVAIDALQPGETVSVSIPDGELTLDCCFVSKLADVCSAEVRASLVDSNGTEVAQASKRQTVYAPDQTLGCSRPIYYASFVLFGCDAVARLQSSVITGLESISGRGAITGYLHDKAEVYNQCKAIYKAIQSIGISYAVSPSTFGQPGQKVRFPDDIAKYKVGCCLDTTLLFAALIEKCGLRPVIILFKEHALVGCHLIDKSFSEPVTTDVRAIRKAVQDDAFVVIETTKACGDASFAEAELSAKVSVVENSSFECAVDVALARGMGIRALPVGSSDAAVEVEGRDVRARDDEMRELAAEVDLEALDSSAASKGLGAARVDSWAQRLLDLSKANRLLNVRDTAKVVPLLCSSPAMLEDFIAADSFFTVKSYENFFDEEAGKAFAKLDRIVALDHYREALVKSLEKRELWSLLGRRETDRRLKALFRSARVDLEESGVNTLFLTLGVLDWCEPGCENGRFRAPVLLIPVKIERRSIAEGYRIHRIDEDAAVNSTLLELLRQEYKLNIPGLDPLPMDESGLDVAKIFGIFRAAVRDIHGLSVSEECMIGRFSFGKFVMWKDLTSRIDAVKSNPIVSHLIERNGSYEDGVSAFPVAEVDSHFDYSKVCCPLSADSSQLSAVIHSGLGKSFVLHGPPGTGKSQTITNIIAHNLFLGRRVLFVSEKKAALDVVYGRLAQLGLAPFCLQLHSNRSGKAEVYAQFGEALKHGLKSPSHDWAALAEETETVRRKLDGYVRALHRQTVSGFTPYELFTRLVRSEIDGDGSLVKGCVREMTAAEYESVRRAVSAAAEMRGGIPVEAVGALMRLRPLSWSPAAESKLVNDLSRLAEEVRSTAEKIESLGGSFEEDAGCLERYFSLLKKRRHMEDELKTAYVVAELRKIQVNDVRRRLNEAGKSFFPVRVLKELAISKELSKADRSGKLSRKSIRDVLRLADSIQGLDSAVSGCEEHAKKLIDGGFPQEMADPDVRMEARMQAEIAHEKVVGELAELLLFEPGKTETAQIVRFAENAAAHAKGNLRQALMYFDARARIPAVAGELALLLDKDEHPVPEEYAGRFCNAFQSKLLNEVVESEPEFGAFFGGGREMDIARFRELDGKCSSAAISNLIAKLSRSIPANDGKSHRGDSSELGILMHECGKKIRQKPIRQILSETPSLTPLLKPCFLMSPLSVAQYLPVDAAQFDLVVFDEASQIPVWDAVGVIARGRQLIVVGDPKQLPPTNFFRKGADEDAEFEDLESILDECLHAGIMSYTLDWHYRSRHESLIAFSNHQYYGNGLNVFPAASTSGQTGVSYVHVPDGVYDASATRTNRREAEAVADIVIQRMRDPACAGKSLGVVAFSEAQRSLIEDIVDERRARHPELDRRFSDCGDEGFFVKNLENVQGDERDAIIFSIGYAPDTSGRFNMIFGPLGNQGGERRLNVAITRAREKIIVVSSIHGHQIDVERISSRGPADLRAFLEYAEKGYRIALPLEKPQVDGFADEVAAVLERVGAKVVRDVGCSGMRVDVAVRDPEDGSRYAFGVVCDGSGYGAERTARDRDRLRDDVLTSLGWNIHHVWIVDWAYDRERAEKKLLENYYNYSDRKELLK